MRSGKVSEKIDGVEKWGEGGGLRHREGSNGGGRKGNHVMKTSRGPSPEDRHALPTCASHRKDSYPLITSLVGFFPSLSPLPSFLSFSLYPFHCILIALSSHCALLLFPVFSFLSLILSPFFPLLLISFFSFSQIC